MARASLGLTGADRGEMYGLDCGTHRDPRALTAGRRPRRATSHPLDSNRANGSILALADPNLTAHTPPVKPSPPNTLPGNPHAHHKRRHAEPPNTPLRRLASPSLQWGHLRGILGPVAGTGKTTVRDLRARKRDHRPFPVLTCYDFSTARLLAEAGIDVILVGDTYGEVILGHDSTLPVTVDHLVTVTEAVRRGAPDAFLIGDMPFLSYQVSDQEAIRNAGKFMAVAGCDCVKLEVDRRHADTVAAMSRAAIPVMAHLGLKPQSVRHLGHYCCQGKTAQDALRIVEDARIMEQAGAVALLLEAVTNEVARTVTQRTRLPVIGCVCGPHCDGQVLVLHDVLGYSAGHRPRAVKSYANLHETLTRAFAQYAHDIVERDYPTESDGVAMPDDECRQFQKRLADLP